MAVTVKETAAPEELVAGVVIGPGTEIVGGVVSVTVTVKLAPLELLLESLAVQLTVVAPRGKVLPEVWSQVIVGEGSTKSFAVTVKVATAPEELVAGRVIGPGTEMLGAVMSWTMTLNASVAVSFAVSVAVQVTVVEPRPNVSTAPARS